MTEESKHAVLNNKGIVESEKYGFTGIKVKGRGEIYGFQKNGAQS